MAVELLTSRIINYCLILFIITVMAKLIAQMAVIVVVMEILVKEKTAVRGYSVDFIKTMQEHKETNLVVIGFAAENFDC